MSKVKVVKILFYLVIVAFGACDSPNRNSTDNLNTTLLDEVWQPNCIFTTYTQKVKYGNTKYQVITTPFIDSISNEYTIEVSVSNKKDTPLTKRINADSLLSFLESHDTWQDSTESINIREYQMIEVVPTPWIRGYNTYLVTKFSNGRDHFYINFAIKVFHESHRLWIHRFSRGDREFKNTKSRVQQRA